jgi:two-component system, CitB family, sensor kinase
VLAFVEFTARHRPVGHTRAMREKRWSLARQLFVLQSLLFLLVLTATAIVAVVVNQQRAQTSARDKVLGIAQTVAANPLVKEQALSADPTPVLQPYAEAVRKQTSVDFVVIMARDRTRWTHPNPAEIGKPFIGTIAPALAGRAFTETSTGTLGRSVRAVAPILAGGRIVGLVSVGITTGAIHRQIVRQAPFLVTALLLLLAVALAGALLVSRRLRRQTRGMDADTLSSMFSSHEAVLHSIREGLVVIDRSGKVGLINDEAQRLLGLSGDSQGVDVADLPIPRSIRELLASGRRADDELHLAGERSVVLNQQPADWAGRHHGTVATLRDRTELESLTGQLDTTRALTESLRSQAHETANRLHTMIVLVETGRAEEAVSYATSQLELSQALTDRVMSAIDEPVLAALLLGKTAQAAERGVQLTLDADGDVSASGISAGDLVTVVGNLVDNAIDASADSTGERGVSVTVQADERELRIEVCDTGLGLPPHLVESAFSRGWSSKPADSPAGRGLGLALVNQVVRRHDGTVSVSTSSSGGACLTVVLPVRRAAGT